MRLIDIIDVSNRYVGNSCLPDSMGVPQLPSLVLGIVTPSFAKTLTFGQKPDRQKPGELDIYPISSITKMLTGLITAKGVADNDFKPYTPVRELLNADIASLVGNRTVSQLVSHRAGFKPRPDNLHYKDFPNSPGKDYSRFELIACLRDKECSLAPVSPGTYLYGDLGIGLLYLALADFYNKSYEQLLAEKLIQDLGMADTHMGSFVGDDPRIVQGFTPSRLMVAPATMGVLAGGGEVLSTGRDMLILLKTMLNPPAQWKEPLRIATTPIMEGFKIGYAIDIINIDEQTFLAKSGDQAGYSSLIMWSPRLRCGAFALTNIGRSSKTLAVLLKEIMKKL